LLGRVESALAGEAQVRGGGCQRECAGCLDEDSAVHEFPFYFELGHPRQAASAMKSVLAVVEALINLHISLQFF
jgi:organic radical activating enzyme